MEGLIHGGAYFRNFTVIISVILVLNCAASQKCSLFIKIVTFFESGVFSKSMAYASVDERLLSSLSCIHIPLRQNGWLWSASNWFRIALFLRKFNNIKTSRVLESPPKKVGGGVGRRWEVVREKRKKNMRHVRTRANCLLFTVQIIAGLHVTSRRPHHQHDRFVTWLQAKNWISLCLKSYQKCIAKCKGNLTTVSSYKH